MDTQTREVLEAIKKQLETAAVLLSHIHATMQLIARQKTNESHEGSEDSAAKVIPLHPCDTEEPKGPA
jgi:enamine deaminase RidA (YjgF/YER057c/UK114 family)